MRILSGPARPHAHFRVHEAVAGVREHDILRFGPDPAAAEVAYDAGLDGWDDLLARLPAGWRPDLVLFWDPHYHPLPPGFERSACPAVAIFMDWFFWPHRAGLYAGFFDALFTNPTGARFLRAGGLPVAGEVNYLGVDCERFAADPAAGRDLDVCLVTTLDHFFRRRRARHLERLARLSMAGLRLLVTNDAHGAAYPALLARAKVAFNDSDFAILNSRTFEGLAAGAAVLEEASNPEARALVAEGVELVLYDEEHLGERLRDVLADDAGRIARAQRGQEQARAFSYEARVGAAIATVAAAVPHLRPARRPVAARPAAYAQAAGAVLGLSALARPEELGSWQRAYLDLPVDDLDDVPLLCALSWVGMAVARRGEQRLLPLAARALTRALALDRGDAVARFNAGRMHELTGQPERARLVWELLAEEQPAPPHPARHGWYVDELLMRDLLGRWLVDPATLGAVLRQGVVLALARLHQAQGDANEARRCYRAVEAAAEDTGLATIAARRRASLAAEQGDLGETAAALRAACARTGMQVDAWLDYARVLRERGELEACRQWCAERAAMLAGFPAYAEARAELAALAERYGAMSTSPPIRLSACEEEERAGEVTGESASGPGDRTTAPEHEGGHRGAPRGRPEGASAPLGTSLGEGRGKLPPGLFSGEVVESLGEGRALPVLEHGGRASVGERTGPAQSGDGERQGMSDHELSQPERWLAEARELFAAGRRFECLHRCLEKLRVLEAIPDLAPPEVVRAFQELRARCYPGISNPLVADFLPAAARTFLDVGCGYGELGAYLKEGGTGRFVCGVELDPERARSARDRLDLVVVADLDVLPALPQRPGGFDCVVFADVLEHLKRPEAALRAAAEVLAPGGAVVISLPNARHWHLLAQLVVDGEWRYVDSGILDRTHLRFFTLRSLQRFIDDAGFVVDGAINALTIAPSFDPEPLVRAVVELGGDGEELRRHLGFFQFCLRARPKG
ncbi:MAG: methyltransferase domain-containing protein [Chloroflexi bacterium]|nr:methyltransferase domain-containing protein [Chloroflexota bacterium]